MRDTCFPRQLYPKRRSVITPASLPLVSTTPTAHLFLAQVLSGFMHAFLFRDGEYLFPEPDQIRYFHGASGYYFAGILGPRIVELQLDRVAQPAGNR
jgi:hypothetical protein